MNQGVYIKGLDLWLDGKISSHFSFISHGHLDHLIPHKKIISTPPTYEIYKLRIKSEPGERIVLKYGESIRIKDYRITLFPSGHILGSSQILIEGRKRLIYTGDIRLRKNLSSEPIEIKPCDILITEATYGNSRYIFPPQEEIYSMIKREIMDAKERGEIPIIFAYPLGKAQETMKLLERLGFSYSIDLAIKKYAELYQRFGIKFKSLRTIGEGWGDVLLLTYSPRFDKFLSKIKKKRTIFLTGWGMDPDSKYYYGVDSVIPLSSHADYRDLIKYIEKAEPEEIFVTHGFKEFFKDLRRLGFNAKPLKNHSIDI